MKPADFDDLVWLYLDGALDADRLGELNEALATRPDLAARFVRLSRIHAGLLELRPVPLPVSDKARSARWTALRNVSIASAGVAAMLLIALAVSLYWPSKTPESPPGGPALRAAAVIVGRISPLSPGDRAILDRLNRLGFQATPALDSLTDATVAQGSALVVISESVLSSEVGTRVADVPVPLLNCEPNLNASLRISTRWARPDERFLRVKQKSIRIADPSHPLAAGLAGSVTIYSGREGYVTWGLPDERAAAVVARCDTKEGEPAIFAHESGTSSRGPAVPARRVGFFLPSETDEAARLTPDGWKLFDAAVRWLVPER